MCTAELRIQLPRPSVGVVEFEGSAADVLEEHRAGSSGIAIVGGHDVAQDNCLRPRVVQHRKAEFGTGNRYLPVADEGQILHDHGVGGRAVEDECRMSGSRRARPFTGLSNAP